DSLVDARARRWVCDWAEVDIPTPDFLGRRIETEISISEIAKYIDWTFFFTAWDLRGRFPGILDHPKYGDAARELYAEGQDLHEKLASGDRLTAKGVFGFWPAYAQGDDIVLLDPETKVDELTRFP